MKVAETKSSEGLDRRHVRRASDRFIAAQQAISRVLAEAGSIDQATTEVLQIACKSLGWDVGVLWEGYRESRSLACRAVWNPPDPKLDRFAGITRRVILSAGAGLPGGAFIDGEARWIEDLAVARAGPRAQAALRFGLRSAVVFPLRAGKELVGVVELLNRDVRSADETLLRLLGVTGHQLGQFMTHMRVAESLRESEEKHRLLLSSVHEAILIFDLETRELMDANDSALRLYGYGKEELLSLSMDELMAQGELPAFGPGPAHRYQRKKDGTVFPADVTTGTFSLKGRPMGISVVRDITERKRAEETEKLRQSEKMQREFVATVSHEFRTPVAAIKGFAETLRNGALGDPTNRLKFVGIIEKHAQRLSRLVEDVLDLCALESGRRPPRPENLTLLPFARRLCRDLAPLLRSKKLSLRYEMSPRLRVSADPAQLSQVFLNLISNAIKFSRRGGRIWIEAEAQGDLIRVAVRDAGPGIAPEDQAKIFERFNNRDARAGGTGLGLSICRQILEAHGGRIWVESERNKGASLIFTLARAK